MRKNISVYILSLVVLLALFVYGCGSHSDKAVYVSPLGDMAVTQRTIVIDDHGRLPAVTFPSGTSVVGAEENTLQPGIKVVLTEQEMSRQNLGYFSDLSSANIYRYKITAFQESSNSAGSKTYVTTIEKPFTVTLPANSKTGLCYLGIRESDTDPWRFFRVGAENENFENIVLNRAATDVAPKECTFNLHRLGTSFCLVTYNGKNAKELPETVVDSLIASSAVSVQTKDGKFLTDLQIKGVLKGLKLGNIKPGDFRTRITYRNTMSSEAPIKVNGASVIQTNKADKTVPGYSYYHTFVVDNVTGYSLISTDGDFDFTLNLNGVETKNIPSGFLLEFYNIIDTDVVLPYSYTEFYTLNKGEQGDQPDEPEPEQVIEPYKIVYHLDGGKTAKLNPTTYDVTSSTIVLNNPTKDGYTFLGWTGSNGDTPQTGVSIEKGSRGDKVYIANYSAVAYSITYNLDGGIENTNPTGYNTASATFTLNNPIKEGYIFIGWTGSNGNAPQTRVTIETGSTENKTYTANYLLIPYNIVYNLDGGNLATDNPTKYDVTSGTITLYNPTKDGCTFVGWTYEGQTTPQMSVSIDTGSTGDRVYNANYMLLTYNIALNLDGGILESGQNNLIAYDVTSSTFILPAPTKDYYRFIGWTGEGITTPQKPLQVGKGSTGDKSYTANYTPISYEITYNLDEGVADNPISYDITSATITLNTPVKDGYSFIGWINDEIAVPQMSVTIGQGSVGNRNYTASYTPLYTIAYNNLEDATVEGGNPATYTVYSEDITLNNPTKAGYSFVGWTEGTATFPVMLAQILEGSTGDKSYTAHWIESITFNLPNGVALVMHKIPAGTFTMGSPTDELARQPNETQHQVTITKAFYIGRFEVTQDQYFAIMNTNPSGFRKGAFASERPTISANYPVEQVSYNDITTANTGFLAQINSQLASQIPSGYRFDLPTEAQWEYACRAKTTTALNSGKNLEKTDYYDSNLNEVAWYYFNSPGNTCSVGIKQPNAWGLYDMHGNVWEWCKDRYNQNYYTTCGDCSDPVGPDTGSSRVRRGGSWNGSPDCCRSAGRYNINPSNGNNYVGFRLVLVHE